MTVIVPPDYRKLVYRRLTLVEFNDVDVDRLMPHLFEFAVKGGRSSRSLTDARDYQKYRERLIEHPQVHGFDDDEGRRVIDNWLTSSVVKIGRLGLARRDEQMEYVAPLTLAAYRAGLPKTRARHRGVDELTYRLMLDALGRRGSTNPQSDLRELIKRAVGDGVVEGHAPMWDAHYDGVTAIDITGLLSLYFLDGFDQSSAKDTKWEPVDSPVPVVTNAIGNDLIDYLRAYAGKLPATAFTRYLSAMLSFHLFSYTLRLSIATHELLQTGSLSRDMTAGPAQAPTELYVDFTRERNGASDTLARRCVERDLERLRASFPDRLQLFLLERSLDVRGPGGVELKRKPAPLMFEEMVTRRHDLEVQMFAGIVLTQIENETLAADRASEGDVDFITHGRASGASYVEQATAALVESLRSRGIENQVKWFWSTGGIHKTYGILDGTLKSRRSWRYVLSDELLTALLLILFVDEGGLRHRSTMPLADVLTGLEARFGILIARPPHYLDGADTRAAATLNLEAFKRRLQLLGCFDSLSDDFSAQSVRHPLESSL